jgi:hypothetical protein
MTEFIITHAAGLAAVEILITHALAFAAGAVCYAGALAYQISRMEDRGSPYWTEGDLGRARQGTTVHKTNEHGNVVIGDGGVPDDDGYMRAVSAWEAVQPVDDHGRR